MYEPSDTQHLAGGICRIANDEKLVTFKKVYSIRSSPPRPLLHIVNFTKM